MERRQFIFNLIGIIFIYAVAQTIRAETIVVDGTTCTLTDAILAANTDSTVGGCTTGAAGADTLTLNANITLTTVDTVNSNLNQGNYAGLPTIVTDITINAGTGTIIQRDGSLGCVANDPNGFRIFNIEGGGSLMLDGLTLQNGCSTSRGGAVLNDSSKLFIQNCIFNNNKTIRCWWRNRSI